MTAFDAPLRIGSLCTGYGGLDAAVQAVLGGELAWVADPDPGASAILAHRHPDVPNLGDITVVDWAAVEPVDVLAAGFPCQDVSTAGLRAGIAPGTRSGLWAHIAHAIRTLNPKLVVIENVRGLLSAPAARGLGPDGTPLETADGGSLRALGAVLGDLADLGFDAEWVSVRASDVGAPHRRERVFLLARPAAHSGRHPRPQDDPHRATAGRRGRTPTDTPGDGRHEGRPQPARLLGGLDAAVGGDGAPSDADGRGLARHPERTGGPDERGLGAPCGDDAGRLGVQRRPAAHTEGGGRGCDSHLPAVEGALRLRADVDGRAVWGRYAAAIRRWELVLGRPAPAPTEPGRTGQPRLAPRFVEWLMGLDDGVVTDVPGLSRNQQLKALGNGVVPQQGAAALRLLLDRAAP